MRPWNDLVPPFAEPPSFTTGWAIASGDDPPTSGTDEGHRQTGLQRHNGRFTGVTSFRYHDEIADPKLSIPTVGLGTRPWRWAWIDLVWRADHQVEAAGILRNSDLDQDPDSIHGDLGQEFDLVLGTQAIRGRDFEVVLGRFEPSEAFPDGDPAWLACFQLRFRL